MKKLVLFLLLIAFVVPQLFSQIIPAIVSDEERTVNREVGTNLKSLFCYWMSNDNKETNVGTSVSNVFRVLNYALAWPTSERHLISQLSDPVFSWTRSIRVSTETGKLGTASPLSTTTNTVSTAFNIVSLNKCASIAVMLMDQK